MGEERLDNAGVPFDLEARVKEELLKIINCQQRGSIRRVEILTSRLFRYTLMSLRRRADEYTHEDMVRIMTLLLQADAIPEMVDARDCPGCGKAMPSDSEAILRHVVDHGLVGRPFHNPLPTGHDR